MSTGGHDRRSFFRELFRSAERAAREVESLRRAADDAVRTSGRIEDDPEAALRPVPALPTTRCATPADLRSLCVEIGRESWADEAVALARTSIRLTPGGDGSSRLGGSPRAPDLDWPVWDGRALPFVARIELAELPPSALPEHGALLVFFALDRTPSGMRPDETEACRVIHVGDAQSSEDPHGHFLAPVAMTPSLELMLPDAPTTLGLDVWELEEWADLRERLARRQGVELAEPAADYQALHRLLGYPDSFAADMAVDAHLVSHGVDLEEEPYAHVVEPGVASEAASWRLLFQLSNDDEVGLELGDLLRLFVWIRDDDLDAGRFDRVRAFVR